MNLSLKDLAKEKGAEAEFAALAAKCGELAIDAYRPMGGATSFTELDVNKAAMEMREAADKLGWEMRAITQNIMSDESLGNAAKADALTAAAAEFALRASDLGTDEKSAIAKELEAALNSLTDTPPAAKAVAVRPPPAPKASDDPSPNREVGPSRIIALLRQLIQTLSRRKDDEDPLLAFLNPEDLGSFTVTKDLDGTYRWFAAYSNRYQDREKEVIPEAEHKEFIAWVESTKAYPELWLWHTPGSRTGVADWVDYANGFALAAGGFDKGMEDVAEKLAADSDLGVSHGFRFRHREQDGTLRGYRSFEISPLPRHRAANEGTAFSAAKEAMMLSKEKRAFLVEKMGEGRVSQIEGALTVMGKEMTDKGVSFKEILDEFISGSPPASQLASKSVPPNEPASSSVAGNQPAAAAAPVAAAAGETPAPAPGLTKEDLTAAFSEAVKAVVAPLQEQLNMVTKAIDPTWAPKATPAAAGNSVTNPSGSKGLDESDPLAAEAARAQKALDEANSGNMPEGPVGWHLQMLGVNAPSANGVGAGV